MDAELRDALSTLSAQVADAAKDARDAAAAAREANYRAAKLERHVFGSNPPPDEPPAGAAPATPRGASIVKRIQTGEHADQEFRARLERVEEMTSRQCSAMGVTKSAAPAPLEATITFLRSREGANLLLRILFGLVALYGAKSAADASVAATRAERAAEIVHVAPAPVTTASGAK